ncbi:unnamed protein product [Peronospora belbahrii]|uniref:Uncharacterized protein n=1 Tax=Peronospora belbahrii TaxID=622444 RepID=A0ABN8CT53_9STRA|nr:unnamed protein product [Peronospora belbahrii]
MEDSDLTDLSEESLETQFHRVKKWTEKSHVKAFGSTKLSHEIVGNYQSTYDKSSSDEEPTTDDIDTTPTTRSTSAAFGLDSSAVDARDVDLVTAFYRYLRAKPGKDRRELGNEVIATI